MCHSHTTVVLGFVGCMLRSFQVMIGEDTLIRFSGCKAGEACTIVLRGARCVESVGCTASRRRMVCGYKE